MDEAYRWEGVLALTDFVLRALDVSRRFGQRLVLEGFSLELRPGSVAGLFGANGAGKTTSLRILTGLLRPTAGTVRVLGTTVEHALTQVGVVHEEPSFYPGMTAGENLEFAAAFARKQLTRAQRQALLERVGLGRAGGPVRGFSLGMRRRLAFAVALAKEPRLLVMDEPTNGLDIDGVQLLRDLVREQAKRGVACLVSTHEWDEAERLVDHVVMLQQGHIICNAPLADLVRVDNRWSLGCPHREAAALAAAIPGVSVLQHTPAGELIVQLSNGTQIGVVVERLTVAGYTPQAVVPIRQSLADVYRELQEVEAACTN